MTTPLAKRTKQNDRFYAALELLGSTRAGINGQFEPNIEARLAAICILKTVTAQSPEEYALVVDILCSYVRKNAAWDDANPPVRAAAEIPADIQAALNIIARTPTTGKTSRLSQIDLTRTDLRGATLWGANLKGAILARVNFAQADLGQGELAGATLCGASLEGAILWKANLQGANLWNANLQRGVFAEANLAKANLSDADLRGAVLTASNLKGTALDRANLEGARLIDVRGITESQLALAKTDKRQNNRRAKK